MVRSTIFFITNAIEIECPSVDVLERMKNARSQEGRVGSLVIWNENR